MEIFLAEVPFWSQAVNAPKNSIIIVNMGQALQAAGMFMEKHWYGNILTYLWNQNFLMWLKHGEWGREWCEWDEDGEVGKSRWWKFVARISSLGLVPLNTVEKLWRILSRKVTYYAYIFLKNNSSCCVVIWWEQKWKQGKHLGDFCAIPSQRYW